MQHRKETAEKRRQTFGIFVCLRCQIGSFGVVWGVVSALPRVPSAEHSA